MRGDVGNMPPQAGVFPDYLAPIVRNGAEGRELVMVRWGMPSPFDMVKGRNRGLGYSPEGRAGHPRDAGRGRHVADFAYKGGAGLAAAVARRGAKDSRARRPDGRSASGAAMSGGPRRKSPPRRRLGWSRNRRPAIIGRTRSLCGARLCSCCVLLSRHARRRPADPRRSIGPR